MPGTMELGTLQDSHVVVDTTDSDMIDIDDELRQQKLLIIDEYLCHLQSYLGLTLLPEMVQPVVDSLLEPKKAPGYPSANPTSWETFVEASWLAWLLLVDARRQFQELYYASQ